MYLFLIIACLPLLIESNNLTLTFDANNSVCTASYTTCGSDVNTTLNSTTCSTTLVSKLLNATRSNRQAIEDVKDTVMTNANDIKHLLQLVEQLVALHNDTSSSFQPLPTSCQEIKNNQPDSPSGVYLLATGNKTACAYCNMDTLCGSEGWTRLAYLNMSDTTQNCPSGFRVYQSGGVRACGRPVTSSGSCVSVQFPSNGISYSQVCGRVVGYQYGSTDAVSETVNNLNSYYIDGVSITRGSPRQHVWSLFAGVWSDYTDSNNSCPCAGGTSPQSFVGNNYFCESGNRGRNILSALFTSDPLWDGQGCYSFEVSCCTAPNIPWFYRNYHSTNTTDYLELRVCGDEGTNNDDAPVSMYEIYVK